MRRAPQTHRTVPPAPTSWAPAAPPPPDLEDRIRTRIAEAERLGLRGSDGRVRRVTGGRAYRVVESDQGPRWEGLMATAEALGVTTQTVWMRLKDGQPVKGHRLRYAD